MGIAVDFTNVLAGPNCGRMLSELGATVYKVEPHNPQHPPMVMVAWQAEGNAGKKTIILDMHTDKGKEVMYDLVKLADVCIFNKSDNQVVNMGLDRETLSKFNPKIIHLNLQARKGEDKTADSANWPGYDPALQGKTGISTFWTTRLSNPSWRSIMCRLLHCVPRGLVRINCTIYTRGKWHYRRISRSIASSNRQHYAIHSLGRWG